MVAALAVHLENASKVTAGMSQKEVEALLGPGKVALAVSHGPYLNKTMVWEDGSGRQVTVMFTNDKVVMTLSTNIKSRIIP